MTESIETLVIGAGQAGLSISHFLKQEMHEHMVLEKTSRPGSVWMDQRWDSFTLVTPNWAFRLPGAEYQGNDPGGFMPRGEVILQFEKYVDDQRLPVLYNTEVQSVTPLDMGYLVTTPETQYRARNVVVATGLFQRPKIPTYADDIAGEVLQIGATGYRNPESLPPGAVLVIGSGQSGAQIAEELNESGRKVYLSIGSAGRFPRRYRGRDGFEWAEITGFLSRTVDMLPSPAARFGGSPHMSGKNGGHNLNLHKFHRDGIVLLGHVQNYKNGKMIFAADLKETLRKVDQLEFDFLRLVDTTVERLHLPDKPEDYPVLADGFSAPEITSLDLKEAGVGTVIWACGFRFNFGMVKLPVLDEFGFPLTRRGKTQFPGLYFLGMPWLYNRKSGILLGVGEDAAYIANEIMGGSGGSMESLR